MLSGSILGRFRTDEPGDAFRALGCLLGGRCASALDRIAVSEKSRRERVRHP